MAESPFSGGEPGEGPGGVGPGNSSNRVEARRGAAAAPPVDPNPHPNPNPAMQTPVSARQSSARTSSGGSLVAGGQRGDWTPSLVETSSTPENGLSSPVPAAGRDRGSAVESSSEARVTRLLNRYAGGDSEAGEQLFPLVYDELRKLARRYMGGNDRGHTLQPTALVNEAWLRLVDQETAGFDGRRNFYALASRIMRSVLVDHARARCAEKRGGGQRRITLYDDAGVQESGSIDLLALDEALERLTEVDPELARIVELRFFGGLNHPEIARATGSSLRTVERNWRLARAWLHGELHR